MSVFCFVFLFHPCNLFLFRAKEKLCYLLAQARVPPSVLVPAVCAVDQNQEERCCQSSGFCQSPVTSLVSTSKQHSTEREFCGPGSYPCVRGGWWLWDRLVARKVLSCAVPQPQKFQHLTYGTGLVISHHRAMLELLQEQLLRDRTEPKALQNLETPPLLLCLRFPTLLVPAGHELKSRKQRWLPRSTDCWCSHLSLEYF